MDNYEETPVKKLWADCEHVVSGFRTVKTYFNFRHQAEGYDHCRNLVLDLTIYECKIE
jgi:hypothetical protein